MLARPRVHTRTPLAWRQGLHRPDRYRALQVLQFGKGMIGEMLRGGKARSPSSRSDPLLFGLPQRMQRHARQPTVIRCFFGLLKRPHFRASSNSTADSLLLRPQHMMMASEALELVWVPRQQIPLGCCVPCILCSTSRQFLSCLA